MRLNIIEVPRPPADGLPCARAAGAAGRGTGGVKFAAPLPHGLAFTERAAADLRAYLDRAGLGAFRVFYHYYADVEVDEVDEHLDALGEPAAAWTPLPGLVAREAGGVTELRIERDGTRARPPGCIHLRRHEVVIARWSWVQVDEDHLVSVWLCAAPTFDHYVRLRDELRGHRHARAAAEWRIVTGGEHGGERVPRRLATGTGGGDGDDLMLPDWLRQRVDAEVVQFFGPAAAELYASLGVPYRRGVMLHGPPGNGKTSLIRLIGARVPRVPGLVLRPHAKFDSDDLAAVVRRWTTQAPGILVIEDLDWLLKSVDVSRFLNLIDGVESGATGGLLLIATTNHPEMLDPAINNRPGRFDVVIEVPPPDEPLRLAYLRRHLASTDDGVLQRVARDSDGLAFAHLQEIVRLSGLLTINAGRAARADDDVLEASRTVCHGYEQAARGFPGRTGLPFGLAHLHQQRKGSRN